jgi:parallel beta-helix repeat protein
MLRTEMINPVCGLRAQPAHARRTALPALLALALAIAMVAATAGLRAADGRIAVASPNAVLSAPGHYYLTADLTASGATAITIAASDVTLDLSGHTLANAAGVSDTGIWINANLSDITIRGGTIRGAKTLIQASLASGQTLRNLSLLDLRFITENTVTLGDAVRLSAASGGGPYENVRIEHCEFLNLASSNGIYVAGGATGRIADNLFRTPAGASSGPAIHLSDTTGFAVLRNRISGGYLEGVELRLLYSGTSGNRVEGNEVQGCRFSGIVLVMSNANLVRNNSVTGCLTFGIHLTGAASGGPSDNLIEENHLAGNAGGGLFITAGARNVYGRNRAVNNGDGGVTNFFFAPGNRSAGDNCDQLACGL